MLIEFLKNLPSTSDGEYNCYAHELYAEKTAKLSDYSTQLVKKERLPETGGVYDSYVDTCHSELVGFLWGLKYAGVITSKQHRELSDELLNIAYPSILDEEV